MQTPQARVPGPERFVLGLALCAPLALIVVALTLMQGVNFGASSSVVNPDSGDRLVAPRPAPLNLAPPPTLAAATATPEPTATTPPVAVASPTPATGRTYTVKPGDELKDIAASYHLTTWQIIDANNIPNPDSLKIGQVLEIPDS
ncbi:MAG: LysM peptidoglycan-binding domain-containing protein [Chloroflexi bacterium]|nr:LysM peptidoglycan-binding domain-containing protein [Chloroflexota bacterium]